jgi:hypothetical protein
MVQAQTPEADAAQVLHDTDIIAEGRIKATAQPEAQGSEGPAAGVA